MFSCLVLLMVYTNSDHFKLLLGSLSKYDDDHNDDFKKQ